MPCNRFIGETLDRT